MSKAEGQKIAIKFNLPLVGDVEQNEGAFTITSQEYLYTDGPDNNVGLDIKTYPVQLVQAHPTEPNSIQLIMADSFRNSQGLITINYKQELGNLAGTGGAVVTFEETFLPEDLTEGLTSNGGKYGTHEYIQVSVDGSIEFKYIEKLNAYLPAEYIEISVDGTIQFINIEDINP